MQVKSGDYVVRPSYGRDIVFKVRQIYKDENGELAAVLKGVAIRLLADAPIRDLEPLPAEETARLLEREAQAEIDRFLQRRGQRGGDWRGAAPAEADDHYDFPGRVLHLDGDQEYLNRCTEVYDRLKIPNNGLAVPEKEQPRAVTYYLEKYRPTILVITGHDSLLKGARDHSDPDNYRSSSYFAEAVRNARQYQPDRDALVIFAGACQSCYELLIEAGANFASSPRRVFIHIFDPVLIIERVAYTPIRRILSVEEVVGATVTGADGVGGVETRGQFRIGYPRPRNTTP